MRTSWVLACVLLVVAGLAAQPAAAQAYWCRVSVNGGWDTCNDGAGIVGVAYPGGIKRLATVDLNAGANWNILVLRTRTCAPTGYWVHIADSPTNNGWAGDAGSTQHDAEAHTVDNALYVFRSGVGAGPFTACAFSPLYCGTACSAVQEWRVLNDQFSVDTDWTGDNPLTVCNHPAIFDFPPYDEADDEDPGGLYADKLYVGLNGIYDDPGNARPGTGVQEACFYLSTDPAVPQATVIAACGF